MLRRRVFAIAHCHSPRSVLLGSVVLLAAAAYVLLVLLLGVGPLVSSAFYFMKSSTANLTSPFDTRNPFRCDSILRSGRFLDDGYTTASPTVWAPEGCVMRDYADLTALQTCLRPGDQVIFYGDSTARQLYWAMVSTLDKHVWSDGNIHGNHFWTRDGITVRLFWDPFLNNSESSQHVRDIAQLGRDAPVNDILIEFNKDPNYVPKTYMYATTGLWHAMFDSGEEHVFEGFKASLDEFVNVMKTRADDAFEAVYFGPTMVTYFPLLDPSRIDQITPGVIRRMLQYSDEVFGYDRSWSGKGYAKGPRAYMGAGAGATYKRAKRASPVDGDIEVSIHYVPVFNEIGGSSHLGLYDMIGLHYSTSAPFLQKNLLLNHMCNGRVSEQNPNRAVTDGTTCCTPYPREPSVWPPFKVLFLGGLVTLLLRVYKYPRASVAVGTAICVACLAYYADRTGRFAKSPRVFSMPLLVILLHLFAGAVFISMTESPTHSSHWKILLKELKGLATALLVIFNVAGADIRRSHSEGAVACRLLYSCWLFASLVELGGIVSELPAKAALRYYASRVARAALLPVVLSMALGPWPVPVSEDSMPSYLGYIIDPKLYPLAISSVFWYSLTAAVVAVSRVSLVRRQGVLAQTAMLALLGASAYWGLVRRAHVTVVTKVIATVVGDDGQTQTYEMEPEVHTRHSVVARIVLGDYWDAFAAIAVCWFVHMKTESKLNSLKKKVPKWIWTAVPPVLLAVVANLLFVLHVFCIEDPKLTFTPSTSAEIQPASVIAEMRASRYPLAVHVILALATFAGYAGVRVRVAQRHTSSNLMSATLRYSSVCTGLASFSYELLLLRRHLLLAGNMTTQLRIIPVGTVVPALLRGTLFGVGDLYESSRFFAIPWESLRTAANLVLAGTICVIVSLVAAGPYTGVFEVPEGRKEELEVGKEEFGEKL